MAISFHNDDATVDAIYQAAYGSSARTTQALFLGVAVGLAAPLGLLVSGEPQGLLVGGLLGAALGGWAAWRNGPREVAARRRAQDEAAGSIGTDRDVTVARCPWGLRIDGDNGWCMLRWEHVRVEEVGGVVRVVDTASDQLVLNARASTPGLRELCTRSEERAPLPPLEAGHPTVRWTWTDAELEALRRGLGPPPGASVKALGFAALLGVLGGGLAATGSGWRAGGAVGLGLVLAALATIERWLPRLYGTRRGPDGQPGLMQLRPEGLLYEGPSRRGLTRWSQITRVIEGDTHLLVGQLPEMWYAVPWSAFADREAFVAQLKASMPERPEPVAPPREPAGVAPENPFEAPRG